MYGALPFEDIKHSSTRRELVGLLQLVRTPRILRQLAGKRVRVLMDSLPALRNLINGGGPVANLSAAVKEWTRLCEAHNIHPVYDWIPRAENWKADRASKLYHEQHTWKDPATEARVRAALSSLVGAGCRSSTANHWQGQVPMFLPMFHQVDARVEMIRATLEEAILIVPEWPAGGTRDWYRRVVKHSLGRVDVGKSAQMYREQARTGHSEQLSAFWLMGRRGERKLIGQS